MEPNLTWVDNNIIVLQQIDSFALSKIGKKMFNVYLDAFFIISKRN